MPVIGGASRDPQADIRTRRALAQLQMIVNELWLAGDIEIVGPGRATIKKNTSTAGLIGKFFDRPPSPPRVDTAKQALAQQFFGLTHRYGVIG